MFQSNYAHVSVAEDKVGRYDLGVSRNSALKARVSLGILSARVVVAGAVATGAAFGLVACSDDDDSDTAPVQTTTVTSTEKQDDNRDDSDDVDDLDDNRDDDVDDNRVNG
ncbi:hypothetical protein [Corynebacterium amycolatum]|uniref:hypothetical protein n=1 Tax=Corynebacterium amycolatum TaxID=43765 RepID=UPI003EE1BB5E